MNKRLSIYDIKSLSNSTSPYFFDRKSMRFFGQTLKDFSVYKQKDGRFLIIAPRFMGKGGKRCGETVRYFNPINNELESQ